MSGNSFVGYGLALVVGIVAGVLAPGVGFSLFYALAAFSVTASLLVRPPVPTNGSRPTDFGNSGRQANTRDAAAAQLNLNASSESLAIPVVFGTCRLNGNHIGYSQSSFRSVAITERHERSPQAVAYRMAQEAFELSPSLVDHEIDRAARKNGGSSGGKGGGGKGGSGGTPPPSQSYSNSDKINAYTAVLLEKDESGRSKLPKEFDEFTVGFKYYLSFDIGICMGEISALHAVLSYPGETVALSRYQDPYITADDEAFTLAAPQQGGLMRFYRGTGTQTRNVADPNGKPHNNHRGVAFASFEDYNIGQQPAPESYTFEVERIPVCLDENEDPIADFELRAGDDTTPVAVTALVWFENEITVTAAGHGLAVGDVAFLDDFTPDAYDGVYTVTEVAGDTWKAQLIVEPEAATVFGKMQGPPVDLTPEPVISATWDDGVATIEVADHETGAGRLVELTLFDGVGWNGSWEVLTTDGDELTLAMPLDPGDATTLGEYRAYPAASDITGASWEAGVATFQASNTLQDADVVLVYDMEPASWNGRYIVLTSDTGSFDVTLNSPPVPAETFGTAQGPPIAAQRDIGSAEWEGGIVTFDMAGSGDHGYRVGNTIIVAGCTPAGYNGTYEVTFYDGDQWSAALATDPGPLTVEGTGEKQQGPLAITAAAWDAGLVTFTVPRHYFQETDSVTVAGMEPDGYNGVYTVTDIDGDQWSAVLVADPGAVSDMGTSRLRPDAGYGDANPAAVLYELFTNRLWGRGLSPAQIDIPSFVLASQYFYAQGIGMSFTIESQGGLSDAVETIRAHANLAIMWVGDKLYCQALNDRSSAYTPRIIVTRDSVIDPEFSRPAWPATFNEVRASFLNRENNFQSELVTVQDDANFQTVGMVNSTQVDLPAVSNREVASLIAQRLLSEQSYPQATLTFRMARYHSSLYPSSFVEFRWPDWAPDGETVTTYWRVAEIEDNDQSNDGIKVTLVEDAYTTPIVGIAESFEAPVPAFEGMTRNRDEDLYLAHDPRVEADLTGMAFMFAELGIKLTDGERIFGVMAQRRNGYTNAVAFYWRPAGSGDYTLLGLIRPWGQAAVLQDALSATGSPMTRLESFEIQLRNASERAKVLEMCSYLPTDSDGFERLTGAEKNWLIVGNEFIQIGQAEAGDGDNRVLITAFIRGMFGSERVDHDAGTPCFFVHDYIPYQHSLRWEQIPVDTAIDIRAIPQDRAGNLGEPYNLTWELTGLSRQALRLENVSATVDGATWTIVYRPRFHNRGSEIFPDLQESLNALTGEIPEGYEFRVMPRNAVGGDLLEEPVLVDVTFTPDDPEGLDPATGMGTFDYDPPADSVALILYQTFNGVLGLPYRIRVVGTDPELETGGGYGDPPAAAPVLRVAIDASTLTNTTQAGTENWIDQDTTDSQANDVLLDWDYTPLQGTEPVLAGGKLTGPIGGFFGSLDHDFTPVGEISFELIIDCLIQSAVWVNPTFRTATVFLVGLDTTPGGVSGYIEVLLYESTTTTAGIQFIVNEFGGAGALVTAAVNLPLDVRQEIGFRIVNIGVSSFDIQTVIDATVLATQTIAWALGPISLLRFRMGAAAGPDFNPVIELHGYTLNSL